LDIFQPRHKLEGRRYTVPLVAEADAILRNVGRSEGRLIAHLAYSDQKLTREVPEVIFPACRTCVVHYLYLGSLHAPVLSIVRSQTIYCMEESQM
jgi:hypothetical protein